MREMKYDIVTLNEMKVVGQSTVTTNEKGKALTDIGQMWQHFLGKGVLESIKNREDIQTIGLYTDYEGDHTKPYRFMCAARVKENGNPELEERVIEAGKYARFVGKGQIQKIVGEIWQAVYASDLKRKFDCDFELYTNDSQDRNNQTIEVYISVE